MRTVVEQPGIAHVVDEARERWPRSDDAWNAVTWVVARDPEVGVALSESGRTRALTLNGARSIGLPSVTIVYVIGEQAITIEAAQFEDAPYGPAGHG